MAWHSPQYLKALKASFPPDRWLATEVTEPDGTVRFVLKDGVEIHSIGPPTEVYNYDHRRTDRAGGFSWTTFPHWAKFFSLMCNHLDGDGESVLYGESVLFSRESSSQPLRGN